MVEADTLERARATLAAINEGRDVIVRESDGAVFINRDVAAQAITEAEARGREQQRERDAQIADTEFAAASEHSETLLSMSRANAFTRGRRSSARDIAAAIRQEPS